MRLIIRLPLEIEKIIEIFDPVYTFCEIMDQIDLNKYLVVEENKTGRKRFDPEILLKVILFAFMEQGYVSVREIEKLCKTDIRFMYLLQGRKAPCHMTIDNFMRECLCNSIEGIFNEINKYIFEEEEVDTEHVYIDGTKLVANANRYSWVWKKSSIRSRDKGVREQGKRMLTLHFCNTNFMLIFLMRDSKADTVVEQFDRLTALLGLEDFKKIFPVILTDNGSEFKHTRELETTEDGKKQTRIFYCDLQASWQKPKIEKNHEYIRYVLPKGKSFNPYTQEDMVILMNNINSTRRELLGGKSPYEATKSQPMLRLMELMGLHLIPADEVNLTPKLLKN